MQISWHEKIHDRKKILDLDKNLDMKKFSTCDKNLDVRKNSRLKIKIST